ncbi:DUF3108 domain-containing protein [candidate division KSB1 bacterium]
MKKNFLIITVLISGFILMNGQYDISLQEDGNKTKGQDKYRSIPNKAFDVGEKLVFDIDWGVATVGSAEMAIPRILKWNGREVYEITSRALSNDLISKIYKVDDRIVSYIDKEGIFSWRLEKNLNEGDWHQRSLFMLDQDINLAYSRKDTVEIPEFCQDVLSAFFYIRTVDLEVGKKIEIPNYDNDKVYYLVVDVLKKQEIRVPAGKFKCIVVEPKLKTQGLFKHQGRIKIYLTDDDRRIPVLMTSEVKFGKIQAKLKRIENTNQR